MHLVLRDSTLFVVEKIKIYYVFLFYYCLVGTVLLLEND